MTQSYAPNGGYKVGNLDDLEHRFKCAYCHLLLRDPMQGDCGHRYCRGCVMAKFNEAKERGQESLCMECDESERSTISPDHTYPDNAIRREIQKKLKVRCPNAGCEQTMLVKDLDEHLEKCKFKPVACDLCGELVPGGGLEQHKSADCPKRPHMCDVCKITVPFDTLDEHKSSECVGSTIVCDFCAARVKDDADAKDRHWKSECPVGWHKDNSCPYGCPEMEEGSWEEHRLNHQASHVDRLLARIKQTESAGQEEAALKRKSSRTADDSSARETAGAVAQEFSDSDYEELRRLRDQAEDVKRKLSEMPLARALAVDAGVDREAVEQHLRDLQQAVQQGDKLEEVLSAIKEKFDECFNKMRQYELKMQKDLKKKLDIEKRHQELVKLLAFKEMKILDLERRVEVMESASFDGILQWKIPDVKRRKEEAREGKVCSIYSPPFYTGKAGRLSLSSTLVTPVPRDGNCFFHAVADQLRGTPLAALALNQQMVRNTMAERVGPLLQEQEEILLAEGLTVQRVIANTRQDGVYVHNYVVPLLDRVFDVDFIVYQRDDANPSLLVPLLSAQANTQPPAATVRLLFDRFREHYKSLRLSGAAVVATLTNCGLETGTVPAPAKPSTVNLDYGSYSTEDAEEEESHQVPESGECNVGRWDETERSGLGFFIEPKTAAEVDDRKEAAKAGDRGDRPDR